MKESNQNRKSGRNGMKIKQVGKEEGMAVR
jgi:hypothetical protein